jgi:Gpi18-like mannosyltransferase
MNKYFRFPVSKSPFTHLSDKWQIPLLVVLQALLFELVARYTWSKIPNGDLDLYFRAARALMAGKLPYRDFELEYPPLALVPFTLPLLVAGGPVTDFSTYIWWFRIQSGLISLIAFGVALVLTSEHPEWRTPALALYVVLVISTAPLLSSRYDVFPAFLTLLALYYIQRSRPALAGWWLGCGVVAKLYPVVLIPIFVLYYVCGRQWRAVVRLILGSVIAILGIVLPFFLLAPNGIFAFLRYHQQRGLQIESLPAGIILLAHQFGWVDISIVTNYGAQHLISPLADIVVKWLRWPGRSTE